MKSLVEFISCNENSLSIDKYINEASDANNTNALINTFIEYYKKYEKTFGSDPKVISIEEGNKIFEKFVKLIENLDPEVRSFGRIQGIFRKRKPNIFMWKSLKHNKVHFENSGEYFTIYIGIPEGKIHWPTYRIYFNAHVVKHKNKPNTLDFNKLDVYTDKIDLYKEKGAIAENTEYYSRILDESVIEKIKELD